MQMSAFRRKSLSLFSLFVIFDIITFNELHDLNTPNPLKIVDIHLSCPSPANNWLHLKYDPKKGVMAHQIQRKTHYFVPLIMFCVHYILKAHVIKPY